MARLTRMLLLALLGGAVIAAPAGAAHVRCGMTVTQDTTFDGDVFCPDDALRIGADGVTLDLNGYALTSVPSEASPTAIQIGEGIDDAHVTDGTIEGFAEGVSAYRNSGLEVSQMTIRNLEDAAIEAQDAAQARAVDNVIENTSVSVNGEGNLVVTRNRLRRASLYVGQRTGTGHATVTANSIADGALGISGDAEVARNRLARSGIVFNDPSRGIAERNVIAGGTTGILIRGSAEPRILRNTVYGQSGDGIRSEGGNSYIFFPPAPPDTNPAVIADNSVRRTGGDGIEVSGGACAVVSRNAVSDNDGNGILVSGTGDPSGPCNGAGAASRLAGNEAQRNGLDGIRIGDDWATVVLQANRAERNGDDGIDVDARGANYRDPAWKPDSSAVAVTTDTGNGPVVWVVGRNGSGTMPLAAGSQPAWSPDGSRLALTRSDGVYVVTATGSASKLTEGSRPQWSPDGSTILFERSGSLWVIPANGGAASFLAEGVDADWSRDSRSVAFRFVNEVYVTAIGSGAASFISEGADPSWSPDGRRIVFTDGDELVSARPDGSDLQHLTAYTCSRPSSCIADFAPDWASSGESIAFLGAIEVESRIRAYELFTVRPDGTQRARLTGVADPPWIADPVMKRDPRWSPDSRWIVFEDGDDVSVIATNGSSLASLTIDVNPLVTLAGNRGHRNGGLGIEAAEQVTDGGGNRANHNGDPRQCVNVSCR